MTTHVTTLVYFAKMSSLGGISTSLNVSIDARSSRAGVLAVLYDHHCGPLCDDEAIAKSIEGAARFFGRTLPFRKNADRVEGHDSASRERRICGSRYHRRR